MNCIGENIKLKSGTIVLAQRVPYYDAPWLVQREQISTYVVTKDADNYFLGCPLTKIDSCPKNDTVLTTAQYPFLKHDSRIKECIYKVNKDTITSEKIFQLSPASYHHFRRKLYERIVLNHVEGPQQYYDEFADEYMKDFMPKVHNIIVYPANFKSFESFYIYNMDDENYQLAAADKISFNHYIVDFDKILIKSKHDRYFNYYEQPIIYKK